MLLDILRIVQIFCGKLTIGHYFNTVCDPIQKMQHLRKLSEHFRLKENGWETSYWSFHYDSLGQNSKFRYCVTFTSINPVHLKSFLPKNKNLPWQLLKMSIKYLIPYVLYTLYNHDHVTQN